MIREYAKFYSISLEDGSQYPGVVGSLLTWEEGRGELTPYLTDSPEMNPIFNPLREKYYQSLGQEVPPLSEVHGEESVLEQEPSAEAPVEPELAPIVGEEPLPVTTE